MDIKQYKKNTEDRVVNVIKGMVNEGVAVSANYDINRDAISLLLTEEKKQEEVRESLVVYNCVYVKESDALAVSGFVRRYGYDAFGIAQIVNDPVTVDEPFMTGIKDGIKYGLQEPVAAPETSESAEN